jgi:putative iron-regulated protein
MHRHALAAVLLASVALPPMTAQAREAPAAAAVLTTYGDIALALYEDSLAAAQRLDQAIDALLASPGEGKMQAARDAWRAARVPYQQTEAFRFGNPVVDEWEGKVNAWPLDEGLIDYVDASYGESSDENPLYRLDVVANEELRIGPAVVDARTISQELLAGELHEALDVESNVATGYHAIEFLLWGQDLNGTGPGKG